jgi:proliferating cell nuclear antigen
LSQFTKASSLARQVSLSLSSEYPLVVEFKLDEVGYLRYYLAPKIDEDEME